MDNLTALKLYASKFDLAVVEGPEEIADQLDIDVEYLPSHITHAAFYVDGFNMTYSIFIANCTLSRFGNKDLGEDPDKIYTVTIEELLKMEDPRD